MKMTAILVIFRLGPPPTQRKLRFGCGLGWKLALGADRAPQRRQSLPQGGVAQREQPSDFGCAQICAGQRCHNAQGPRQRGEEVRLPDPPAGTRCGNAVRELLAAPPTLLPAQDKRRTLAHNPAQPSPAPCGRPVVEAASERNQDCVLHQIARLVVRACELARHPQELTIGLLASLDARCHGRSFEPLPQERGQRNRLDQSEELLERMTLQHRRRPRCGDRRDRGDRRAPPCAGELCGGRGELPGAAVRLRAF